MLRSLFKRSEKSPDAAFWEWFEANSTGLLKRENIQDPLFDKLSKQLAKIHGNLVFEIGPIAEKGRDFIVSCDGIPEGIPYVEQLFAAAPSLEGWNFIKFRPRREVTSESSVQLGDTELRADHIWFDLASDEERPGKIALYLFIAHRADVQAAAVVNSCYLLLDEALGEYDVMTKVGGIGRYPLPADTSALNLKPFAQLPAEFDALYSKINDN